MQTNTSLRVAVYCLCTFWIVAVTYASLKAPSLKPPPFFLNFAHSDKIVHFVMYFGMSFWLFYSAKGYERGRRYTIALLVCVVYGIAMEGAQELMALGRSMDAWDVVANTTGAASFLLISVRFERISKKLFPRLFADRV